MMKFIRSQTPSKPQYTVPQQPGQQINQNYPITPRVSSQNTNVNQGGQQQPLSSGVQFQQQQSPATPIRPPPPLRRVDSNVGLTQQTQQLQQQQPQSQQQLQQRSVTNPGQQPLYQQFAPQQIVKQPIGQPFNQAQSPRPVINPGINPRTPGQLPPRPPFQSQPNQSYQQQPQAGQTQRPPFVRPQQPINQAPQIQQQNPVQYRPQVIPQQIRQTGPPPIQQQFYQNNPTNPNQATLRSQNSLERIRLTAGRDSPDRENRMASEVSMPLSKPNETGLLNSPLAKDDDDDVVIGRATTPKPYPQAMVRSPSQEKSEYLAERENISTPPIRSNPNEFYRSDSNKSIPSRPPSASGYFPNGNAPKNNQNEVKRVDGLPPKTPDYMTKSSSPNQMSASQNAPNIPSPDQVNQYRPMPQNLDNLRKSSPSPQQTLEQSYQRQSSPGAQIYDSNTPKINSPQSKSPSPISLNTIINPALGSPTTQQSFLASQNKSPIAPIPPATDKIRFNQLPNQMETTGGQPKKTVNDTPRSQNSSRTISSFNNTNLTKGDNDSGVDESTQGNEKQGPGSPGSPLKSPSKIPAPRPPSATSNKSRSTSKTRSLLSPETPTDPNKKKLSMNKVQVGAAPSPNLKVVRSKIGSLENATYKPGGGQVKIESKRVDIRAAPRIEAKNEKYQPGGGDKKIQSTKLHWNAKSKIGSLENANHKPGGGDKKIETLKTDFKDKAKPKVGSKDNMKYAPGGGDIKIQTHKLDIKAQSKIGSLDNVKYKPGGGDVKIFDDKEYLKNVDHPITPTPPSQLWRSSTLTTSLSLPAECIVLSLTTPSTPSKSKADASLRMVSARPKSARSTKDGRAIHPRPFRNY